MHGRQAMMPREKIASCHGISADELMYVLNVDVQPGNTFSGNLPLNMSSDYFDLSSNAVR
jgi:hypothetical protein